MSNEIDNPHTISCKVTGKCGSVTVRQIIGIEDCYVSSKSSASTLGNLQKLYYAIFVLNNFQPLPSVGFKKSP